MAVSTASLTEQHRLIQVAIRAEALHDFTRIWPVWTPTDPSTFQSLLAATKPLVDHYHGLSAAAAVGYYEALRSAERVIGTPAAAVAAAPQAAMINASLYVTGEHATRVAIAAGQRPAKVRETTLIRVSGAVSRHILDGGRDTIIRSVQADKQAVGWARVTDGNPCYFCLTLASRGAVYKTEQTAGFEAHDHCGCVAMPLWGGTELPAETNRWRDVYEQAQREGVESGALQGGENTSAARLNAVRRYLAKQ